MEEYINKTKSYKTDYVKVLNPKYELYEPKKAYMFNYVRVLKEE